MVAELFCSRETVNQKHFPKSDSLISALAFGLHIGGPVTTGERDVAPAHLLCELQAERRRGSLESPTSGKHVGKHGGGGGRR